MIRADLKFTDGYVSDFTQKIDGEYELSDDFNLAYMNCYHLVDGEIVLDQEKYAGILEQDLKNAEINELKEKLSETNYVITDAFEQIMSLDNSITFIADFIKILRQFKTKYASMLAQRKEWRDRIEELSK